MHNLDKIDDFNHISILNESTMLVTAWSTPVLTAPSTIFAPVSCTGFSKSVTKFCVLSVIIALGELFGISGIFTPFNFSKSITHF